MKRMGLVTRKSSLSFRHFLAERFASARRGNRRYSLRSFARQLNVNHSTLSQVLRGRRPLTRKAIQRMGAQLGLSERLISFYSKRPASAADTSYDEPAQAGLDQFHVFADWYHRAILALVHVKSFRADSRWVARSLGITVDEANVALQRLLRLGFLKMEGAKWVDRSEGADFGKGEFTPALRKKVRGQGHRMALDALESVPEEFFAQDSILLAIDSRKLARVNELAREFFENVQAVLGEGRGKDDVYEIQISAFPVTAYKRGTKENG